MIKSTSVVIRGEIYTIQLTDVRRSAYVGTGTVMGDRPEKLQYTYANVYSIRGIRTDSVHSEQMLLGHTSTGLRALLTHDPTPYLESGDRALAISYAMLTGLLGSAKQSDSQLDPVEIQLQSIKDSRGDLSAKAPYLVIVVTGSVACADGVDIYHHKDFDVCFDLVDKDSLKRSTRKEVDRAVAAFLLSAPAVIDLTRIADPITFEQESGRPIFTFTPKGGLGFAYISSDPQDSLAGDMATIHNLLSNDSRLGDVSRLLRFSYEFNDDPYRALS
jgi:hypothetical protein